MNTDLLISFQKSVADTPGAVAVAEDGTTRTYADLDRESAGYASALHARGVGPETVVAIVSDRCGQYVAMALGVLRAGAAFVPVEPYMPARRARQLCETAKAHLLFVQPGQERYAAGLGPEVLVATPDAAGETTAVRHPGGLAYVIFTSGSTGAPKGVMVVDEGMNNHIEAKVLDLDLGPADVIGFTAPLSFDISVWQCFTAMAVGAVAAVASPKNISEPAELVAWVRRQGVTVLEIVPSFLSVVVDELRADEELRAGLGSLRFLIATGEALPAEVARRWYEYCPDIPVVNAYGPTECSDDVTHHFVTYEECADSAFPPIGREIINTRIHLVDGRGRAVEPGAEGELMVGGIGVGRGYIADPVRTALAFVPDHLSGDPGKRLYRTGDRGIRSADGAIEFLGRRDRQVKVRGHRVELGDVEAELLRVPGVGAAASVLSVDRLYGFVTGHSGLDGVGVHEWLRASAPHYLLPHRVFVLERMPTNTSGKVDHRALLALVPDIGKTSSSDGDELAGVQAAFAEVLGLPEVRPGDDFFQAGGDSLRAMTLVSLVRRRFGAPGTSMRAFLSDPTPQGLHAAVLAASETGEQRSGELSPGALSSGQERLWFLEQLHRNKDPQLIRLALTLRGELDVRALRHGLEAVVARHEPLRTVYSQQRGIPTGTVRAQADVTLEVAGEQDDAPRGAQLSASAARPPLMTAGLARTGPDLHELTLVLHHLVADGWSLTVLGREIATYYQRWVDGDAEVPLPETTFGQYVRDERRWLAGEEAVESLRYWTEQLTGAPATIDLPMDRSRPAGRGFAASSVVHELTEQETAALAGTARSLKATPFMAVMAAFYQVLADFTGCADIVIGVDAANRSWPGSEQLIGMFVNQLPVRFAAPQPTFGELLALARRQCLGAYEHDRMPFHRIVAAVNPPREAGRFPLFQVKVTQQGAWREGVSLPGVEMVPVALSEPETDVDLLLDVSGESSGLRLELIYQREGFDTATATALVTAVGDLLRAGASDPGVFLVKEESPDDVLRA
ncbi:amino acid adenylation domain-containing protein [Lentzea sp. CA-135723]|uniref:amino acid adenylation domain-containing protein n=1 Tax=Lentzea sp. CA-135723 TaxID=3239950 RepID=UPI003D8FE20C